MNPSLEAILQKVTNFAIRQNNHLKYSSCNKYHFTHFERNKRIVTWKITSLVMETMAINVREKVKIFVLYRDLFRTLSNLLTAKNRPVVLQKISIVVIVLNRLLLHVAF